jgi:hypothetical protein
MRGAAGWFVESLLLAASAAVALALCLSEAERSRWAELSPGFAESISVSAAPLDEIEPGTKIGDGPPKPWTHLIVFAKPRLAQGDVDALPGIAKNLATKFCLVLAADVTRNGNGTNTEYKLARVGAGFAMDIKGQMVVVNVAKQRELGANLGFIALTVLEENEKVRKNDVRQVARTETMIVFDAKSIVLKDGAHQDFIIRHAVLVDPRSGKLSTFCWLMKDEGDDYVMAEDELQLLPPDYHEDRAINVDGKDIALGIPGPRTFALVRVPPGTPIRVTPELSEAATVRTHMPQDVTRLEAALRKVIPRNAR